jgi:PAS domain S-box-containing protein
MENPHEEYERIKDFLKQDSQGMNIREIAEGLNVNRNSIAKYLDILTSQDEVDVRIYGKSKVYRLAQRVPISGLLQFSSNWIIILNSGMKVVQLNDAYIRYSGMQINRIMHRNISDIPIIPCNHPAIPYLAGMALSGKEVHDELSFATSTGRVFLKVTATPTIFQDQSAGIILVFEDITERKKYEIALKHSEEKFRNLVEASVDWIWEIDSARKYTYSSPQVKIILGYEPEEIVGKTPFDLMQPRTEERESRLFFTAENSGDNNTSLLSFENTFVHKDGHLVILETKGIPFYEKSGAHAGYRGIARDITDYKRTQFIQGQYQFLQQLIDTTPNPVYYKDTQGFFRGCNRAFENILGRDRTDIIGKTAGDLFTGEYADYYSDRENELLSSSETQTYEYVLPRYDGSIRNVIVNNAVFTHPDGSIGGLVCVIVDITERKRMEDTLRESEIQLTNAMELAHLVKWELDISSDTFTFDDRFYSLYGTTASREGGLRMPRSTYVRDFIHPDDIPFITEQSRNILVNPQPGEQPVEHMIEHRIVRRDGDIRHVNVRSKIVQDSGGRIVRIFGVNQDITDRRRIEERMAKIYDAFLAFGPDPITNINILTGIAGTVLNGTCALYNRLESGMLCSLGAWNTPEDYIHSTPPEGHVCYEIIRNGECLPTVIPDLMTTTFADTDPNVRKYQLRTYLGIPVKIGDDYLGTLCVIYRNTVSPSPQDLTLLSFLAKAVAVEDERRIALKSLRERIDCSAMVTNAPGMALLLRNGEILSINETGVTISGYPREELAGRNIRDFLSAEGMKQVHTAIQSSGPGGSYELEIEFIGKNGRINPMIMSTRNISDKQGESTLAFLTDISERKLVEDALKKASRKHNILVGITRHDVMNQLMALGAYIQISEDAIENPSELSNIIRKERKIVETIGHLISFTQDYEDIGIDTARWMNVHTLINSAIALLPVQEIRIDPGDPDLEIFADTLLERVFFNLVDNALRYGGEGMTAIRISNHDDEGNLVLVVEDDGIGIRDDDKKEIFSKGFGKNTGLGLYLCREILSITGITIIETGIFGAGARFEIRIPQGTYRFRKRNDAQSRETPDWR